MVKALVIAGSQSSVGKTTVVVGLAAALRARGLVVQPFKVGPDYIDPGHHTFASGRPCRNLDTWMMTPAQARMLFEHGSRGADIALIEGVMGLFDGLGYGDETGSTAQIAKLLGAPVLLVIDAAKMARSAAALARGFQEFDRDVTLAGYVVNRAGSESHGRGVSSAIEGATQLPVLGWLPRDEKLQVPERHLGLRPHAEPGAWQAFVDAAAALVETHIDVGQVLALAADLPVPAWHASGMPARTDTEVVIAVARDEAFHFCYEENLALLEQAGATLRFFSPLHDANLPVGTAGVLLSGGFPEVYAEALSKNVRMHESLRRAHREGMPIYAECGGLMALTEAIVDFNGRRHPMAAILPGESIMTRRLTLGYREARALAGSWLMPEGEVVRGHEFHYSTWNRRPDKLQAAYILVPPPGKGEPRPEGAVLNNLWASYVHLHWWGKPELAERFVSACRPGAERRLS